MACNSLSIGRALPCTSSVGGIKAIYVAPFGSLGALTITGGEVTAIGNDGVVDLYKYDLEGSNGLEQAVTASAENGSVFYEQTLTKKKKKLDLASQQELIDISTGYLIQNEIFNYFSKYNQYTGWKIGCTTPVMQTYLNIGNHLKLYPNMTEYGPESYEKR